MAMVVETGAGLDNATSLCSLAVANGYNARHPDKDSWEFRDSSEKENLLEGATIQIQDAMSWHGRRTRRAQALDWPRTGLCDKDGWQIASNTIPLPVSYAVAELARILGERRDAGQNTTTPTQPIKKVELGPISIEMATPPAESVGSIDRSIGDVLPRSVWMKLTQFGTLGASSGGGSGYLVRSYS